MANQKLTGGCFCGQTRFELLPPWRDIVACHCGQCRKMSGHYLSATSVRMENFVLQKDDGLRWHSYSKYARRGFCYLCGSSLFWQPAQGDRMAIFAGALDDTADLRLVAHIYTANKADYYTIDTRDAALYEQGGISLNHNRGI